jgi:hypothetical protein
MPATPPETMDVMQGLLLLGCLVIALGAYGAERRWAKSSKILAGPAFHEAVERIQAGQVDAVGFGVLQRAYHQRQPTLPGHLKALQEKIETGQRVSLYDPERHRQIEPASLEQFTAWAQKHFPDDFR